LVTPLVAATQPSTRPTEYTSLQQIVHTAPATMYPKSVSTWTDAEIEGINAILAEKVVDQEATLVFTVGIVEKTPAGPCAGLYRIQSETAHVGVVEVHLIAYFTADATSDLAQVRKGSRIKVHGHVSRSDIDHEGKLVPLHIDLTECVVKPR
jgi:hypothetical protein